MRPALAALLTALAACADGASPGTPTESAPVVVADGRSSAADDAGVGLDDPAVAEAVREALADRGAPAPGFEDEPAVLAAASGSFTRPEVEEQAVLYLLNAWPRCCPSLGLAVVERGPDGGRLVRNVAFEGSFHDVRTIPGLAGDGHDGLVLVGGFGQGGYTESSATVAAFGPDGLAGRGVVPIYEGGCGVPEDGETAARLVADGGALQVERFRRDRCRGGEWVADGDAEPFVPAPPSGGGYRSLR